MFGYSRVSRRPCSIHTKLTDIPEIYRAEPARRRECLYYLALGHYKMGNYEEAKKFNGAFCPCDCMFN